MVEKERDNNNVKKYCPVLATAFEYRAMLVQNKFYAELHYQLNDVIVDCIEIKLNVIIQ